jgi:hypothetical protein
MSNGPSDADIQRALGQLDDIRQTLTQFSECTTEWPMEFNYADFYNYVTAKAPRNSTLVEVGSYVGVSLSHLAVGAHLKNENIRVVGVDWGIGIPGGPNDREGIEWRSTGATANKLVLNLHKTGIPGSVPVVMWDSALTARLFANKSCFMVYIDADHNYESVRRDIKAWKSKVQYGGILAGHDYDLDPVMRAVEEQFGPCSDTVPQVWAVRRTWLGWRPLGRSPSESPLVEVVKYVEGV